MDSLLTAPGRSDASAAPTVRQEGPDAEPQAAPPARGPEPKLVRRIVTAALVGALLMFAVAALDAVTGRTVPVLGTIAALPAPPQDAGVTEPVAPPSTPGICLNWSRPDAADAAVVDCAQSHLFEQAGSVVLTDQTALPDDRKWRQLVTERCTPVVQKYLNGKFDPNGRYRIGALKPSPAKWEAGDRELRCGLQSSSRSGALYPMTGKAATSDQSDVQAPGTCLAIDGRSVGDPVDCSGPHAVETVGVVDLSEKFKTFPAVGDQDGYLQPTCAQKAADYAGGPDVVAKKKLTVYWDNLVEASWKAGSHKVNCNLAALLPDRSGFAPVTGSVRGNVQVGNTAAPPATSAPQAGSPVVAPEDGKPDDGQPAGDKPAGGDQKPQAPPASPAPPAPSTQPPPPGPPPGQPPGPAPAQPTGPPQPAISVPAGLPGIGG